MTVQAMIPEADGALLRRFTDTGDPDAFAEIVRRYAAVVYAASHRILGDEARAQDVSQETFFRLLRQPRLVTHSLGGWLHRSATHLAIDARRSEISRRKREKTYGLNQEADHVGELKWEDVSPYVDEALNDMEEPARTLLVRHFLQGTPQAELAVEMETSSATISRKIKAGVEELQKHLRKKGVYLGSAMLAGFFAAHPADAMSVKLLTELGKMRMVGPIHVAPPLPPSSPARYPRAMKMPKTAATTTKATASYIAAALLLVVFGMLVLSGLRRSITAPAAQNAEHPARAAYVVPPARP
jgi:RNA polymerase sigma-70 factor (ECF subfamily)